MNGPIVFPDAQLAVRNLLRAILRDWAAPGSVLAGATVSTDDIPGADEDRPLPYVQVRSDGRFRNSRLNGRATIRVLAYGQDVGESEQIAGLLEALLLSEVGVSAEIRGSSPVAGPLPSSDPDNGLPFSFFTITTRLRPSHLSQIGA